MADIVAPFQAAGRWLVLTDVWKVMNKGTIRTDINSLRTHWCMLSGPGDFEILSLFCFKAFQAFFVMLSSSLYRISCRFGSAWVPLSSFVNALLYLCYEQYLSLSKLKFSSCLMTWNTFCFFSWTLFWVHTNFCFFLIFFKENTQLSVCIITAISESFSPFNLQWLPHLIIQSALLYI